MDDKTPIYTTPAVRSFARKLGVDIQHVAGTGPGNRIMRTDVEAFVKTRITAPQSTHLPDIPDWPKIDFGQFGAIERQPLSRIERISGAALMRNAMLIPHVTNFDKADITDLDCFRKSHNEDSAQKLTLLAFAVKAAVSALQAYPRFNTSLDGDSLIYKYYWNIGIAVNTDDGLVVPVIKQADAKGLQEIASELAELAAKARSNQLKPFDVQGATFTISSLGAFGSTNFAPLINAPEVAILGMAQSEIQPVWSGESFVPRLIQPISLSFDHRAIDGVAAVQFLQHLANDLSDFRRLII